MAWTDWLSPRTVTYFETDEVEFADITRSVDIVSVYPVTTSAFSTGELAGTETNALLFADYAASGIAEAAELRLHVSRLGRIQDKTIRLRSNSEWIGENAADLSAVDVYTYSWQDISVNIDSDLGVVIDLQPHTEYPSSNTVYIRNVQMKFDIKLSSF